MRGFLILIWCLVSVPVQAALYKCTAPDGQVSYQQHACSEQTEGGALTVDTRSPDGGVNAQTPAQFTIERQLEQLAPADEKRDADAKTQTKSGRTDRYDSAKCARHRAQAAKWEREVKSTYRDRSEQIHNAQMLKYHQALIERYCEP